MPAMTELFLQEDAEVLYNKLILGNDVWYFRNVLKLEPDISSTKYDEFKHVISCKLGIHLNNICIVGSAKTGFSLKTVEFRPFRLTDAGRLLASDVDIAVICDRRFNRFWDILLEMKRNGRFIQDYSNVASCVFRKFIRTDIIPETYDEVRHWHSQIDAMTVVFQAQFGISHKATIRLYESWDGLKNYQLESIRNIKYKLSKGEA